MRGHVIEIAAAGNLRLQAPGKRFPLSDGLQISKARRFGIAYLHVQYLADAPAVDDILHLLEIRQITTVVGNETGHPRLLSDTVNACAILIAGSQRLLYVNGFASLHGHDGIGGMTRWRRTDIDSIHIRVIDEFLSIGIPFFDAVRDGVGTGMLLCTAHHSHHRRPRYLAEGRTALLLRYLTTSDEAPF